MDATGVPGAAYTGMSRVASGDRVLLGGMLKPAHFQPADPSERHAKYIRLQADLRTALKRDSDTKERQVAQSLKNGRWNKETSYPRSEKMKDFGPQ
eukprot:1647189-Amphidinium_carterae.1